MALVVETGAGVTGANTLVSHDDALSYALDRGVTLADDDTTDASLLNAMTWLNGQTWKGEPVAAFQPLAFPRKHVYITGSGLWDATMIPPDVKNAQIELAMQIAAGVDIFPVFAGGLIIQETVGPIVTKYSDKYGAPVDTLDMPVVNMLLKRWLDNSFGFRLVRA